MKVGLIGAGKVGSACLLSLVMRSVAHEIVVINRTHEVARGVVTDIQYGAALFSPVELCAGDYGDLDGAQVVLITAGINEQAGGATDRSDDAGRLRLLDENAAAYREIVPKVVASAPQAVILVITDPPDPLADLARKLAGHDRVMSAGTFLDTLRFRFHLARALGVHPGCVEAQVLGEHGTSQVFVWSSARIAGIPVPAALGQSEEEAKEFRERIEQDVRYANITIIEGTGASQLGIGLAVARMTEMILRDEQAAIPIGVYNSRYGVTLSLPTVVGRSGVTRVLEPDLAEAERKALDASADTLRQAVARLDS
jgi:L-lactate dehydrogenase